MLVGQEGKVPSKQWSCSELKDGAKQLHAIKKEYEEDLADKIQEPSNTLQSKNTHALLSQMILIEFRVPT